jgi:hypothetical protein
MKTNIKSSLCKVAALLACATTASAVTNTGATLFLWDDTGDTVTVSDGGGNDASAGLGGVVQFSGNVGANWQLVVDVGTSKPLSGSATHPLMDLSFNHLAAAGAGSLSVAFFDNAFGPTGLLGALAAIGGTFNSDNIVLTYTTYTKAGNTTPGFVGNVLDLTGFTQLTTQSFNSAGGPGPFGGTANAGLISGGANPFSLLQVITVTTRGPGQVTGDSSLRAPDGGMTLMLLGSSLTALAFLRRSFKSKA